MVHRADERIVQPREAVQKGARARIRLRRGERGVRGVTAVEQNHGRPVLPGVRLLCHPRELHAALRRVVVLHAHHRVPIIRLRQKLGDVAEEKEVVVREQRPALVVGQVRHEEAAVRELRALLGVLRAPVQAARAQLLAIQRLDVHRHGRVLLEGKLSHLERDVLVRVVPEEHPEGAVPGRQRRARPLGAVRGDVLLHRLRCEARRKGRGPRLRSAVFSCGQIGVLHGRTRLDSHEPRAQLRNSERTIGADVTNATSRNRHLLRYANRPARRRASDRVRAPRVSRMKRRRVIAREPLERIERPRLRPCLPLALERGETLVRLRRRDALRRLVQHGGAQAQRRRLRAGRQLGRHLQQLARQLGVERERAR